jgi:hypothetical protein
MSDLGRKGTHRASAARVSDDLVVVTRMIVEGGHAERHAGGILGGEYGYGVDFENDIFRMRPYCWCDRDDCAWCLGCTCPDGAELYFLADGTQVDGERFYDEGGFSTGRVEKVPDLQCALCRGEVEPAPNFLHKPTGSKVSWYKYLGRGVEMELWVPWRGILDDVLRSINQRA